MELRIPPLLLTVATGALMWLAHALTPDVPLPPELRIPLAVIPAAVGMLVCGVAVRDFRIAATTVNPLAPDTSTALVAAGVYRFSRNPMYLGFLLVLIGWAVFLSNAAALVLVPLFVLYLNRFQIIPEERALERRFGSEYRAYCERVRRWV